MSCKIRGKSDDSLRITSGGRQVSPARCGIGTHLRRISRVASAQLKKTLVRIEEESATTRFYMASGRRTVRRWSKPFGGPGEQSMMQVAPSKFPNMLACAQAKNTVSLPKHKSMGLQNQLALAVDRGDVEDVQLILRAGADVNFQASDGSTSLHAAIQSRNVEMVQRLICEKADCTLQDQLGNCPFHCVDMLAEGVTADLFHMMMFCPSALRVTNKAGQSVFNRFFSWSSDACGIEPFLMEPYFSVYSDLRDILDMDPSFRKLSEPQDQQTVEDMDLHNGRKDNINQGHEAHQALRQKEQCSKNDRIASRHQEYCSDDDGCCSVAACYGTSLPTLKACSMGLASREVLPTLLPGILSPELVQESMQHLNNDSWFPESQPCAEFVVAEIGKVVDDVYSTSRMSL